MILLILKSQNHDTKKIKMTSEKHKWFIHDARNSRHNRFKDNFTMLTARTYKFLAYHRTFIIYQKNVFFQKYYIELENLL